RIRNASRGRSHAGSALWLRTGGSALSRRNRSQQMGRRAALILCLGLATWLLLWWTGRAGPWTTAAVGAGVALLLLVNLWAAPRRPGSAGPHHPEAEAPRERAASVPEYLSHRPNAVRPDYNTLPDVWPPHPPRVIKPAPQPVRRESMPEPAPPQDPPAAEPAP